LTFGRRSEDAATSMAATEVIRLGISDVLLTSEATYPMIVRY
jgi:hypothetical protein